MVSNSLEWLKHYSIMCERLFLSIDQTKKDGDIKKLLAKKRKRGSQEGERTEWRAEGRPIGPTQYSRCLEKLLGRPRNNFCHPHRTPIPLCIQHSQLITLLASRLTNVLFDQLSSGIVDLVIEKNLIIDSCDSFGFWDHWLMVLLLLLVLSLGYACFRVL